MRAAQIETLRLLPRAPSHCGCRPQRRPARHTLSRRRMDRAPGGASRRRQPRQLLSFVSSWRSLRIGRPSSPTTKPPGRDCPTRCLPIDGSLVFLDALHARWVALLESMSDEDFQKGFNHPERGRMTLATNLAIYDWHSRHHTAHIANLRERMAGKGTPCTSSPPHIAKKPKLKPHRPRSWRRSSKPIWPTIPPQLCLKTAACSSTCVPRVTPSTSPMADVCSNCGAKSATWSAP